MSREMWIHKTLNICGITLSNKSDLNRAIKQCKDDMEYAKNRINKYVFMTEFNKFIPEYEKENIINYLETSLEELWDMYDEARIKLTRLWEFEEEWDKCHIDDKAILPINPKDLDKIYMGGDWVEHILEDGSEVPDDYWDVYHGHIKPEDCSFAEKLGYTKKVTVQPL